MPTKTLWDIAIDERKAAEKGSSEHDSESEGNIHSESHLLVCGSKESGKSSILQKLNERDDGSVKSTVGLDYIFMRKAKDSQNNKMMVKDVAHVWELGGGIAMSNLLDVVISERSLRKLSVAIVLDMAAPEQLWETQHVLIERIRGRINEVVSQCSQSDPALLTELKQQTSARVGEQHPDKNRINPILVPIVFIAAKTDKYQEYDAEKRQMICKTLRFIAHMAGAMVQFFSTKNESQAKSTKQALNHLLFNTQLSKSTSFDMNKTIVVPFGADNLDSIGQPPISNEQLARISSRGGMNQADLWKAAYDSVFPPVSQVKEATAKNPATDPQFKEQSVDQLRMQKDKELERYRKLCEKKMKEDRLNADVGRQKKERKK